MKRSIALALLVLAPQAVATFAGEPMVSSKQVIAIAKFDEVLHKLEEA